MAKATLEPPGISFLQAGRALLSRSGVHCLEKETDTEELLFILRIFLETRAYFSKREEVVPTNIIDQPLQSGAGDLHSTLECSRMITS
jgi:hypothetical protein